MKKQIVILGFVAASLFFLGVIFKSQHWPGATILSISGSLIGVIFLILYLFNGLNAITKKLEKTALILGTIAISTVLLGFVFKMMHWPGANVLLICSHTGLFISAIAMLIDAYKEKDEEKQSVKVLFSFTIFILMTILLFFAMYTKSLQP